MKARPSLASGKEKDQRLENDQPLSLAAVVTNMRAQWGETIICLAALFLYAIGAGYEGEALTVINTVGPLIFSVALMWGIVSLIQRSVNNLWVTLFWYRVAML